MKRFAALSNHPLTKRLVPLLCGMLMSTFLLWIVGNTWVEATVRGATIIMGSAAIFGAIATKKDGLDNPLAWFIELIPAFIVVLVVLDVGGEIGGRQDHMRVMGPYLGAIAASPIIGSAIRAILSSKN